jgi:hypothetical protein
MWNVVSVALGENCQFKNVEECLVIWLKKFSGDKRKVILVGVAAVMWSIWKARNLACFQHVWPNDPYVVMFCACYWIDFWSNLQVKKSAKGELRLGARLLEQIAVDVFRDQRGWAPCIPMIGSG